MLPPMIRPSISYLASRLDLERSESRLEIGDVGLQLVESGCNAGLDLRGMSSRWAVGRDLVEGCLRHLDGWSLVLSKVRLEDQLIDNNVLDTGPDFPCVAFRASSWHEIILVGCPKSEAPKETLITWSALSAGRSSALCLAEMKARGKDCRPALNAESAPPPCRPIFNVTSSIRECGYQNQSHRARTQEKIVDNEQLLSVCY